MDKIKELSFENAEIMFKNFSGNNGQYANGTKTFCVKVDDKELAEQLFKEGWNIKAWTADPDKKEKFEKEGWNIKLKENIDDDLYFLTVKIGWNNPYRLPKIHRISDVTHRMHDLTEDTIEGLDSENFKNVDLTVVSRDWDINGKAGVTAWVDEMYVTVRENPFAAKYVDFAEAESPRE